MNQTFWVYVSDRGELAEPEWQSVLEAATDDDLFLCGHCAERHLPLARIRVSGDGPHYLRAARNQLHLHHADCWVHTLGHLYGPPRKLNVVYPDDLFMEPSPGRAHGALHEPHPSNGAAVEWRGDAMHLVNACIAGAVIKAFRLENDGLSYRSRDVVSPPQDSVFDCFAEMLRAPFLKSGLSPAKNAQVNGLRLFWFVTNQPLADRLQDIATGDGELTVISPSAWDPHGPLREPVELRISREVARQARGRMMAFRTVIPPPYLVFASMRGATVVRLCVLPVATGRDRRYIHVVDSSPERFHLDGIEGRCGVLKPAVALDLNLLGSDLWPFERLGALPNRPDAIVFEQGKIRLIEVLGSSSQNYLRTVARRMQRYRIWSQCEADIEFEEISANRGEKTYYELTAIER